MAILFGFVCCIISTNIGINILLTGLIELAQYEHTVIP